MNVPNYITSEQWADWCEYRTADNKKGNWSDRAQRAFLRTCERLHDEGFDVPALIDHAMVKHWLTIYKKDEFMRKRRARETTVTDLTLVVTDRAKGAASIAEMKQRARQL